MIVTFDDDATRTRVDSLAKNGGFAVNRRFQLIDSFSARVTPTQAKAVAADPRVRRVEPTSVVRTLAQIRSYDRALTPTETQTDMAPAVGS